MERQTVDLAVNFLRSENDHPYVHFGKEPAYASAPSRRCFCWSTLYLFLDSSIIIIHLNIMSIMQITGQNSPSPFDLGTTNPPTPAVVDEGPKKGLENTRNSLHPLIQQPTTGGVMRVSEDWHRNAKVQSKKVRRLSSCLLPPCEGMTNMCV